MPDITDNNFSTPENEFDPNQLKMSLIGHLDELRRRLLIAIGSVFICSTVSYFFAARLVHFVTAPAGTLYFMNPAEAFFTYLKVSVFVGFLAALPVVIQQLWSFVLPALNSQERYILILVPCSVMLFYLGLAFSYFLVLPTGLKFFMGFSSETLQPLISLGAYLSFVISFLLPFGIIFELPLVILMLAKLGIVNSSFLVAQRKSILVLAFVIGAIITPTPDVISQTMVAVPLLVLYETSIAITKYVLKK